MIIQLKELLDAKDLIIQLKELLDAKNLIIQLSTQYGEVNHVK